MHLYVSEGEWMLMNFISPCVHDCTEDKLIENSRVPQHAYQTKTAKPHERRTQRRTAKGTAVRGVKSI